MTAGVAAAANRGTGTALPARQSTSRTVKFTETDTCASIGRNGSVVIQVCAVHNSLDGAGAGVATTTFNGTTGAGTATTYFADGVRTSKVTATLSAPDTNGLTPYTATGTCTGGTGVHKHEKCSVTETGAVNAQTGLAHSTAAGTVTR